ncbi:MAG TPA: hypothetical protein VHI14_04435 [Jatrophihabitantaceae bacterium]|nr:hypothetical protein [Jatrophihabitantaceae bacterium]
MNVRFGGPEAVQGAVWRAINSPALVGHLCPWCQEAVQAEGALGASSIGRAAVAHLQRSSKPKALRLRRLLDDGASLSAWGSQPPPRVPNAEPFGHLRLDRL